MQNHINKEGTKTWRIKHAFWVLLDLIKYKLIMTQTIRSIFIEISNIIFWNINLDV
jgi:hypothetical protein